MFKATVNMTLDVNGVDCLSRATMGQTKLPWFCTVAVMSAFKWSRLTKPTFRLLFSFYVAD